jgi:hypothetical protein
MEDIPPITVSSPVSISEVVYTNPPPVISSTSPGSISEVVYTTLPPVIPSTSPVFDEYIDANEQDLGVLNTCELGCSYVKVHNSLF